ncbi:MAG: hypothetical protein KC635_26120 [Myxococcales bacterium]|nr:hypothetical protein [Myxococcales bacterium]MCB9736248.1 hypothetical protein [Deltaproteobacteria bacterium]
MRRMFALTLAAAALAPLTACDTLQTGTESNFSFKLDTDDRLFPAPFNTPIAAGFSVDVETYLASDTSKTAEIVLAQSLDQSIARVTGTTGNRFTVEGRQAGTATIEVKGPGGGDTVDMSVAELAKVKLTYPGLLLVPASPPIYVAEGGTAYFGVTLMDATSRTLVGYGQFPVTITPSSAGAAKASTDVAHLAVTFTETGAVTLEPLGESALEVTVVPVTDIATLAFEVSAAQAITVNGSGLVVVRGEKDDASKVFGLSNLATVTATTPDTCRVEASPRLGDAVYTVYGKASGACALTATLGALSADATVTIQ